MDFEHFYINWYSRAKYFAKTYVLSEEEAENITQDVFLDLYRKADVLDDSINWIAYLFTSIKNKCIDCLRRELLEQETLRKMQHDFDLTLRLRLDTLELFETELYSEHKLEDALRKALDTLPGRCREIFIKKLEGKKYKEIAKELCISEKTVENQISIAYKKLKKELKDYMLFLLFLL